MGRLWQCFDVSTQDFTYLLSGCWYHVWLCFLDAPQVTLLSPGCVTLFAAAPSTTKTASLPPLSWLTRPDMCMYPYCIHTHTHTFWNMQWNCWKTSAYIVCYWCLDGNKHFYLQDLQEENVALSKVLILIKKKKTKHSVTFNWFWVITVVHFYLRESLSGIRQQQSTATLPEAESVRTDGGAGFKEHGWFEEGSYDWSSCWMTVTPRVWKCAIEQSPSVAAQ